MAEKPEENAAAGGGPKRASGGTSTLGQELYQTLRSLVWIILAVIFVFTFFVRLTVVDGSSMQDTLQHGDIVLTWRIGYTPRQGDVVVLTKESFRSDSIIKRVIATAGQTVDIDYAANTVAVDGVVLSEPYIREPMRVPSYGDVVNHLTVPEGCVFVLGDNRNHSSDSRYPGIGVVDVRCVLGKAVLVLFPFSDLKRL